MVLVISVVVAMCGAVAVNSAAVLTWGSYPVLPGQTVQLAGSGLPEGATTVSAAAVDVVCPFGRFAHLNQRGSMPS
jgi:hypothetical protein